MFIPARMVKIRCTTLPRFQNRIVQELQNLGAVEFYDVSDEVSHESGMGKDGLQPVAVPWEERLRTVQRRMDGLLRALESVGRIPLSVALFGKRAVPIEMRELTDREMLGQAEQLVQEAEKEMSRIGRLSRAREQGKGLRELKKRMHFSLLAARERLYDLAARTEALKRFGRTKSSLHFGFYTPRDRKEKVLKALERVTGKLLQAEEVPLADAPVLLRNPPLIKSFEWISEGYSYPQYNGIDPTPLLAVGFLLLFGLMFADMGFGLLLAGLSLTVLFNTRKADAMRRDLNIVLAACGFSSVLFGFLFGEFFGTLVTAEAAWFEPAADVYFLLVLSLLIGTAHLALGAVSRMVNDAMGKRLPVYGASQLMLLAGLGWAVRSPGSAAAILLLASGLLLLAASRRGEALLDLLGMFANVLSFLRVGALSLAHILITALLAAVIKGMPDNLIGILLGAALFVLGSLALIVLGTLVVAVQSARLYMVEFLSQLYDGAGRKFSPLSLRREYLYT